MPKPSSASEFVSRMTKSYVKKKNAKGLSQKINQLRHLRNELNVVQSLEANSYPSWNLKIPDSLYKSSTRHYPEPNHVKQTN